MMNIKNHNSSTRAISNNNRISAAVTKKIVSPAQKKQAVQKFMNLVGDLTSQDNQKKLTSLLKVLQDVKYGTLDKTVIDNLAKECRCDHEALFESISDITHHNNVSDRAIDNVRSFFGAAKKDIGHSGTQKSLIEYLDNVLRCTNDGGERKLYEQTNCSERFNTAMSSKNTDSAKSNNRSSVMASSAIHRSSIGKKPEPSVKKRCAGLLSKLTTFDAKANFLEQLYGYNPNINTDENEKFIDGIHSSIENLTDMETTKTFLTNLRFALFGNSSGGVIRNDLLCRKVLELDLFFKWGSSFSEEDNEVAITREKTIVSTQLVNKVVNKAISESPDLMNRLVQSIKGYINSTGGNMTDEQVMNFLNDYIARQNPVNNASKISFAPVDVEIIELDQLITTINGKIGNSNKYPKSLVNNALAKKILTYFRSVNSSKINQSSAKIISQSLKTKVEDELINKYADKITEIIKIYTADGSGNYDSSLRDKLPGGVHKKIINLPKVFDKHLKLVDYALTSADSTKQAIELDELKKISNDSSPLGKIAKILFDDILHNSTLNVAQKLTQIKDIIYDFPGILLADSNGDFINENEVGQTNVKSFSGQKGYEFLEKDTQNKLVKAGLESFLPTGKINNLGFFVNNPGFDSLYNVMNRKDLTPKQAFQLSKLYLGAMLELNAKGFTHDDLHTKNVMARINPDGSVELYLIDVGLLKKSDTSLPRKSLNDLSYLLRNTAKTGGENFVRGLRRQFKGAYSEKDAKHNGVFQLLIMAGLDETQAENLMETTFNHLKSIYSGNDFDTNKSLNILNDYEKRYIELCQIPQSNGPYVPPSVGHH